VKILATYNIKGGVGKTAAAVNLSYLAAREGARTLVWDLDPQGAATYYFRVKPKIKGGSRRLLKKDPGLEKWVRGTDYDNLHLLPADFSYRHLDLVLDEAKKPARLLRKVLKPLADEYDYAFLDCPPSISLVSEAVFRAAHALLVPLIPTTLSLRTLEQLISFRDGTGLDDLAVIPFFSMVDRRKRLHREILESLPRERPEVLAAFIPYASDVEQMGIHRQPVACYAGRGRSAAAYESLWREARTRLEGRQGSVQ
jgi:cellulose biosynthesis protein BcsQ